MYELTDVFVRCCYLCTDTCACKHTLTHAYNVLKSNHSSLLIISQVDVDEVLQNIRRILPQSDPIQVRCLFLVSCFKALVEALFASAELPLLCICPDGALVCVFLYDLS